MRLVVAWMLAGVMLAACETVDPDDGTLATFFNVLVFPDDQARLIRWESPVRIALSGVRGEDPEDYRARVVAQASILASLSGLDIAFVDEGSAGVNYAIVFIPTDRTGPGDSLCEVFMRFEGRTMIGVEIKIGTQPGLNERQTPEARIDRCIAHEMMHSLGFPGHPSTRLGVPSVMINSQPIQFRARSLTPWDELAVRVLYDARLETGMTKAEAEPIVRKILAGLSPAPGG
jgi:hypothetical protein